MIPSEKLEVLGVIPARLASTRLPRKPLCMIEGKTLIERVWRRASQAKLLSRVVVATDSDEIASAVVRFGGEVVMTGAELPSGSARVAETARICRPKGAWDAVVNIQGDMPFIRGEVIDKTVDFLLKSPPHIKMATMATPIISANSFSSKSVVKVVLGADNRALYFSRAPIPCSRDGETPVFRGRPVLGFKHIGLYVYRPEALSIFSGTSESALEQIEKLEQLKLLERGEAIGVCLFENTEVEPSVEVDTPADLERAAEIARELKDL